MKQCVLSNGTIYLVSRSNFCVRAVGNRLHETALGIPFTSCLFLLIYIYKVKFANFAKI